MSYMNMNTGEITNSHREAVEWFRTDINICLYDYNYVLKECIVSVIWEH